jgi:transposase
MTEKRRSYSQEFKLETLRLLETSGKPARVLERELGIGDGCLGRWKQKFAAEGEKAFPGPGRPGPDQQDEVARLRRELEIALQERDILKKAIAIFSHPSK